MNTQESKKLYNALLNKGYTTKDLGNEQVFLNNISDANKRRQLYDFVSSRGDFKIGDFNSYEKRLVGTQAPNPAKWVLNAVDSLKNQRASAAEQAPVEQTAQAMPKMFRETIGKMRAAANNEPYVTEEEQKALNDEVRTRLMAGATDQQRRQMLEQQFLPEANEAFDKALAEQSDQFSPKQTEQLRKQFVNDYMNDADQAYKPVLDSVRQQEERMNSYRWQGMSIAEAQKTVEKEDQDRINAETQKRYDERDAQLAALSPEGRRAILGEEGAKAYDNYMAQKKGSGVYADDNPLADLQRRKELKDDIIDEALRSNIDETMLRLRREANEAMKPKDADWTKIVGHAAGDMTLQMHRAREYGEYTSPERLWEELNKDGAMDKLLNNEKLIKKGAEAAGMSVDDYMHYKLIPELSQRVAEAYEDKMHEKYDVKGFGDYLMRRAASSAIGTIFSMGVMTRGERERNAEAIERAHEGLGSYKPGVGGRLAGEVAMLAPDAPILAITGGAGGVATKAVGETLKRVGLTNLGRIVSTGSPFLAANVGKGVKYGGLAFRNALHGAASMGTFMGSAGAIQDLSIGDGTWESVGRAFLEGMGEGAKFGAAMGVIGTVAGSLGSRIAGTGAKQTAKRVGLAAATFAAENQLFANMDRFNEGDFDWVESTADAFYMQMAGKLSSPHGWKGMKQGLVSLFKGRPANGTDWNSERFRLTDGEREQIQKAFAGMDLGEISDNPENIQKILNDKQNISWVARQKVAGSMGMLEPNRPRTTDVSVRGKQILEHGENGELVEVHDFKDPEEAMQIRQQIEERIEDGDMKSYLGILDSVPTVPTEEEMAAAKEQLTKEMQAKDPDFDPESLDKGHMNHTLLMDYVKDHRQRPSDRLIAQFAAEHGMEKKDLYDIINKKPIERTDKEYDLMKELSGRAHDMAFPEDKLHPRQSVIDGENMAGSQPLSDPETAAQLGQEINQATSELNAFMQSHDKVRYDYERLIQEDAPTSEIIRVIAENNSGTERDEAIRLIIRHENALAKRDGFLNKSQRNVDNYVAEEVDKNSLQGTVNGNPEEGNIITITNGQEELTLINANIVTDENGRINPDESTGVIIARDKEGNIVTPFTPSAEWSVSRRVPKDEYANTRRNELVAQEGVTLAQTGVVPPSQPVEEKKVEQPSEQAGGEAGATATGANEPPAAAPSEVATESQQTEQPQQEGTAGTTAAEIPVDKDNVKLYEHGTPIDVAINDIQQDGYDPNRFADLAISEAQAELAKIKEPKTRAELVKSERLKAQLQNTISYYEQLKKRKAELETLNKPAEEPAVPENSVPLQPKAASERPKSKAADEKRAERVRQLKEEYGEDFDDDFSKAQSAAELAAMYVGRNRTIDRDDLARELGYKVGIGTDEPQLETLLAKKGEGASTWDVAHAAYESDENPIVDSEGTRKFSDKEIHDALIDEVFRGANRKSDIMDFVINSREEMAKRNREGRVRAEEEAKERGEKPITLTDEEVEKIESQIPFTSQTDKEIPDAPITKLQKESERLMQEEGTPKIDVVDTDRMTEDDWRDLAEKAYEGAFIGDEEVEGIKKYYLKEGVFFDEKTGKITVFSGKLTPEELRERVQTIKDFIHDRSNTEGRHEEENLEPARPAADREDAERGEASSSGENRPGERRAESESSERDEYLKPSNDKEKQIVDDVNNQLQKEIDEAIEERDKAASALEKAKVKESDRATDMFSDDNAFKQEGQLFDFEDMPTDRSQEGVNKRTQAEADALAAAQRRLDRLQSVEERNSRIRGALDNERRQTQIEGLAGETEGTEAKPQGVGETAVVQPHTEQEKPVGTTAGEQGAGEEPWEKMGMLYEPSKEGKKALVGKEFENRSGRHTVKVTGYDEATDTVTWTDNGVERKGNPDFLRKDSWKEKESNSDPMAVLDEIKKEEGAKIGITHDETPQQQTDKSNEEKLNDTKLTTEEIRNADVSDVQKTLAEAYLNGNTGALQTAAYLNIYNNVRNRRQDREADSTNADGAQLVGGENQPEQRPGRTGGQPVEMAQAEGAGQDEGRQLRVEDGQGQLHPASGEGGDRGVPGAEPAVGGVHTGGVEPVGGRQRGVDGSDVRGAAANERGAGNTRKPAAGSDAAIAASKKRLAELRQKFKDARRNGEASISFIGMNNEQIGILMDITTESANLGYQYISKGINRFNEWRKQMWEDFHDWLREDMKWSDAEIDEYINEVWNCEYNIDGVTRTISEWASYIGEKNLRNIVREDLNTKREKQIAAESIAVKNGDIDNIRETLPYLLPEQQEDVLKTETQFFDPTHQDREHGFGKGMMFTNGTGTGKTYTGLGIAKRFVKQGKGRVLIITPSQEKVSDWKKDGLNLGLSLESLDEDAKNLGTSATKAKGSGVVVTTYANARQNLKLLEDCFDLVIYDESHKITEGKDAAEGEMYKFHQMLTNKDVEKSIDRQTYYLPLWIEQRNLQKEFLENEAKLKMLDDKSALTDEESALKDRLNKRQLDVQKRLAEIPAEQQPIRESKRAQAEKDTKTTKTVFLSATPFNTRENLKYAEGYIFSFPEEDKSTIGSYNHRSPQDAFYEQYFPAGYRWRYGRLENHIENPEALGRQEIDFSDYLQNQLGTLSGRMITSEYDYSRDFPVLTLDHAGRFNQAMSEVYRNDKYSALAETFRKAFDYNYSTALFEAMKTSLVNERIQEHLNRGQKVVVFHRRRTSAELEPPFQRALDMARLKAQAEQDQNTKKKLLSAIAAFEHDFADMLEWEKTIDYTLPREQIENRFGKNNVAFFSGAETKGGKHKSIEEFMKDNGGKDIIVVQEASGKEGISLHDQTGEHQRVEINLALPQSPIAFIQQEGRIYRIGQKSNAIFEYPLLGLDLETSLFAQKFNGALGTTENLALGSKARNLRKSIANSVLENSGVVDYDRQGYGGKDMDGRVAGQDTEDAFDVAISDYYGNHKMQRGRDNREGVDYFPTPEPVGYKMVEWAQLMEGESALEPSAGHGAIARYVPERNALTAIEPSSSLFGKLQMRAGGPGRRFEEIPFEDYKLLNKHDAVLMNPPYGVGGKTAMEHVQKAFKHLNEGGRLIAIIPDGPAMQKRLDAWLDSKGVDGLNGAAVVVGEVKLPSVAFSRAGTSVNTRIVVIDKVSRPKMRDGMPAKVTADLSGAKTVEELFESIRNVRMPERTIDKATINQKRAQRTMKAFEDNRFVREATIDENGIRVRNRSSYGGVPELYIPFDTADRKDVRNDLLLTVEALRNAADNAESIEYGKWKTKTFGSGKNAVKGVDAIREYCDTAIKTIENVYKTTEDEMMRELKGIREEQERARQERERQRELEMQQKMEGIKPIIDNALAENRDNPSLTTSEIERDIKRAHLGTYTLAETAKRNLKRAGIDWQTGNKIVSSTERLEKAYNDEMPLDLDTMKNLMTIAENALSYERKMAAKRALEMSGIHSGTGEAKEGFDYSSHDQYYEKELRDLVKQASGPFAKLETKQQRKEREAVAQQQPAQPTSKGSYEYKLDKNTRTGEDMHLVKMNDRLSDADYKSVERKAKALDGYYNRFKKAWHFKTEEDARKFMESVNAGNGNDGSPTTRFRLREKEAPKKTQKVYKLMRLGDDGKLYPLFIDAAEPTELGKWYDADSPDMSILQKMPEGTFLVDYANGTYKTLEEVATESQQTGRVGKNPTAAMINEATKNGQRWVRITATDRGQRRYGGENRKYMNLGINGSGQVGEFAMRPGWHAGSLPSMRQIGKGKDRNLRDDRFVWVEGEVPADREWQSVADQNPDKDIPTQIPEDGFYMKATNANKAASQADRIGWYVAGAFKPNRIMSDVEARNVITEWNKEHPDQPVEYDFDRESGKDFNAETMQLEDRPTTRFSRRKKKTPETAVPGEITPFKATRISDVDGAKVLKNLDELVNKAENIALSGKKTFLNNVADAIGAVSQGSGSKYADFETANGENVTIRLANHNATVSGFDYNERQNGISIVISRGKNEGVHNDGNAHIVEFFYPEKELNKADGHPYAEIVKSLKQALYSGEYKDSTGIAKRQEVNADSEIAETLFRKRDSERTPREQYFEKKIKAGEKLAKKLNSDFEAITDISQVKNKEALEAIENGEEVPGWVEFDKDGKPKIFLYLPHVRDTYDAEKTIAHEVIGHKGLRELLGEKAYKSYMRSLLFDLKDPELSKFMEDNLARNNFDIYRTIDEYLAYAAEKGFGKLSMWQKVRNALTDALRSMGFTMAPSISDVKYMVWLSQNQLKKGEPLSEAKREALLYRLGKERYEAMTQNGEFTYDGKPKYGTYTAPGVPYYPGAGRTLFRHTPSTKYARLAYEKAINRMSYVWKEAHIDQMQAAVELMRAISGEKHIEDIPSAENFILEENQMSSKEEQMDFLFNRDYMKPLDEAVRAILPEYGSNTEEALRKLQLYMVKKHGLERNRVLYVRDAIRDLKKDPDADQNAVKTLEDDYNQLMDDLRDDISNGQITLREYFEQVDEFIRDNINPNYKADENDYSGLTSMAGTRKKYDDSAFIDDVMSEEDMIGEKRINDLWDKTNAVSQFGLDMEYEGGLDSKEKHDRVSKMFKWYVPLRGFDEKTAEEVYDYLEDGKKGNWAGPILMNAGGRESLSDIDVFAQLGAMDSYAIHRALQNQMKQTFARFIRNHYQKDGDNRLVTELKYQWAEQKYDPQTQTTHLEEVFPQIPEDAKADDVAQIVKDFEDDMKAKEANGQAKRIRQNTTIPYRPVKKENLSKHIVEVYINGEKKTFVVNGNPRAAQAINGQLKAEKAQNWASSLTNFMAKMNTSYSPDFIMRNTERDLIFTAANLAVKESLGYWKTWAKNYAVATGRGAFGVPAAHTNLFKRYRNNELNMNNETDRYFKEFMENGGETGWVETKNLEKWKKEILKGVDIKSTGKKAGLAVWNNTFGGIGKVIEAMNERAENLARFSTYMTSRQRGRSVARSVSDAKEVTVNFNRKGAGKKSSRFVGSTPYGDAGTWRRLNATLAGNTAQYMQNYLMFYNAGVQAVNNMAKTVGRHPVKGTMMLSAFLLAGMMPAINQFLSDELDEKQKAAYADLPEWVRRNNLCIYAGDGEYITIALPIELRAMYGIGDMAASFINRPELRSTKNAGEDILTQLSQVLPLDFMGEGSGPGWALVPSAAKPLLEAAFNTNWLGNKIERDDTYYKHKPTWMRAFKNVNDTYINLSKGLNALTNPYGDENIKGWADGWLTDPAKWQHVVEGYLGGAGSSVNRVANLVKHADDMSLGDLVKSNWMPIVRTQHYGATDQTRYSRTKARWNFYKDEMEDAEATMKVLRNKGEYDHVAYMRSISESEGLKGERARIMKEAEKAVNRAYKALDATEDEVQRELIQQDINQIMQETVETLDAMR